MKTFEAAFTRVTVNTPSKDVRDLIFQMVAENPSWGAPRIHVSS